MNSILPFPRGDTAGGHGAYTPTSADFMKDLRGYTVEVNDDIHGTNMPVVLLAVQAETAMMLNKYGVRYGVTFDGDDGDWGRQIGGTDSTTSPTKSGDGTYGLLVDDAYGDNFKVLQYDWFWCVLKGPVYCTPGSGGITVGYRVAFDSAGLCVNAAAGDFVLGTAVDGDSTHSDALVLADMGLSKPYAHT